MADSKVFHVRFGFSMSKSPRGQVLSRFRWIGAGFIRIEIFKKRCFFNPFMGLNWVCEMSKNVCFYVLAFLGFSKFLEGLEKSERLVGKMSTNFHVNSTP